MRLIKMMFRLLPFACDNILGLLKWPVALLMVVLLPGLIQAFYHFSFNNMRFFAFLGGMGAYLGLKIMASARSNISMQILAHEFTHIFFALLTFHRVTHIHLNMDESGGAMTFRGKGNWLIVIGPYFFPLFLFFFMLGMTYFSQRLPDGYMINGILGYFFAYHLESITVQIHGQQPDFKVVGFPFCFLFLPGANLLVCSIILAFNNGGWVNVLKYIKAVFVLSMRYFELFIGYFNISM